MSNPQKLWAEYLKDRSDKNRNAILVHYMPFIEQVAETLLKNPAIRATIQKDELCSAGVLGLMSAIKKYDPSRGEFGRFAYLPVKFHMQKEALQISGKSAHHYKFPEYSEGLRSTRQGAGGGQEPPEQSYVHDVSKGLQRQDLLDLVEHHADLLTDQEAMLLSNIYKHGLSRRQCAEEMGLSIQQVDRIKSNLIEVLQWACGHEGEFEL